jgi:hypothetical protein
MYLLVDIRLKEYSMENINIRCCGFRLQGGGFVFVGTKEAVHAYEEPCDVSQVSRGTSC